MGLAVVERPLRRTRGELSPPLHSKDLTTQANPREPRIILLSQILPPGVADPADKQVTAYM